ncbi:hypothetical protein LCGC14_1386890 [marine sediment metagenome]|uniref:Uncharacterized protein n=1 Tax=marine sediment metagenome TaxID=412755 RepID=A0A0F9N2R0_9ZZZZ
MTEQEFSEKVKKPAREIIQAAHEAWVSAWEAYVAIENASRLTQEDAERKEARVSRHEIEAVQTNYS